MKKVEKCKKRDFFSEDIRRERGKRYVVTGEEVRVTEYLTYGMQNAVGV